jgi:hypothetical protein
MVSGMPLIAVVHRESQVQLAHKVPLVLMVLMDKTALKVLLVLKV